MFDAFAHGKFGPLPFSETELRELSTECPYKPAFSAIDPFFRVPVAEDKEEEIRATLRAKLQDMAEHRQWLWMNDSGLSLEDRGILWKAFVRNTIDLLITRSVTAAANDEIAQYGVKDSIISLAKNTTTRAVENKYAPPEEDQTSFDLLRTSNERIYSVALTLFPMLTDIMASNTNAWRSFLVNIHLTSAFPPYTEVSMSMSAGISKGWWIIVFANMESNDGRLLAGRNLGGRCFVYDTANWKLYEHLLNEEQLSVMTEGIGQRLDGSAYFLDDYRCGDLLNALNCANSLSHAWTLRDAVYPNNNKPLSDIDAIPTVFGCRSDPCSLLRADGQSVEFALGDDRILLEGKREGRGVVLTNAAMPSIGCSFKLAPNQESIDKGIYVSVNRSLFGQGVVIRRVFGITQPNNCCFARAWPIRRNGQRKRNRQSHGST